MTTFAPLNRDVAQLVAHYVRDVGVGRSSRLIPTFPRVKCLIIRHLIFFNTEFAQHLHNRGPFWGKKRCSEVLADNTLRLRNILNIFIKPSEQNGACIGFVMARKCRPSVNIFIPFLKKCDVNLSSLIGGNFLILSFILRAFYV